MKRQIIPLLPRQMFSTSFPPLALTPTISELLAQQAPVAIGVSGGKDSAVAAYVIKRYLDSIDYRGTCLLIYSDLGLLEWRQSRQMCEHLAQQLGLELVIVDADMLGCWKKRWQNNVSRYQDLRCVRLIMPWSGPGRLRFCTANEKLDPICRELVRRFPGQTILSASGIRREESDSRQHALICKAQPRLFRKRRGTAGYDWHPILDYTLADVLNYHHLYGIPLHPAYEIFGCSRVSCVFCVLSSRENLIRAARCEENHEIYRQLVALEILSTFSFQGGGKWLGDIAPDLLDDRAKAALADAKRRAQIRIAAEKRIPETLLYRSGWPTSIPTWQEACLLSEVRRTVAGVVGFSLHYTEPDEIISRYVELMAINKQKEEERARREQRRQGVSAS